MTDRERKAVASFMFQMLEHTFPTWREFPLEDMARVVDTQGEGFEGTRYEDHAYLIHAFYMVQAWKTMFGLNS